ncbi:MAG: 7-cyano-7-deazaguanine synthase QueC [Clostridioides sp.]|nr:7-cyano-7-deazaguanine synthase QueC [Clostridioides sp.]
MEMTIKDPLGTAVVVLSGGQDSTTCLFWAIKKYKKVIGISFDYGQKHIKEIECAKNICLENNIEHHIIELPILNTLTENSLTRIDIDVDSEKPKEGLPNSFVDGRNMLFLNVAAIFAKQKGAHTIITGVSQTDFSGYPDCRYEFIKSMEVSLTLAMDYPFSIKTPLMWLDKSQVWNLADELGVLDVIREKTITCYNGIKGEGCGKCPACKLRNEGYKKFLQEYKK